MSDAPDETFSTASMEAMVEKARTASAAGVRIAYDWKTVKLGFSVSAEEWAKYTTEQQQLILEESRRMNFGATPLPD